MHVGCSSRAWRTKENENLIIVQVRRRSGGENIRVSCFCCLQVFRRKKWFREIEVGFNRTMEAAMRSEKS